MRERRLRLDPKLSRNFRDKNQNSALRAELRNLQEDHGARGRDEWEPVTRPPQMTSLLPRWLKQLRLASREH